MHKSVDLLIKPVTLLLRSSLNSGRFLKVGERSVGEFSFGIGIVHFDQGWGVYGIEQCFGSGFVTVYDVTCERCML